jgi:hypothetical protein
MKRKSRKSVHYTVDDLKHKLDLNHSEELFGIEIEIPQQCPKINSFIDDIKAMRDHINRLSELIDDNENNTNKIYIERECNIIKEYEKVLIESFEEVRDACQSLRTRGEQWKQLTRNLFDNIPYNKKYIDPKFLKQI